MRWLTSIGSIVVLLSPTLWSGWWQLDFQLNREKFEKACVQTKTIPVCKGTCQLQYRLSKLTWYASQDETALPDKSQPPPYFDGWPCVEPKPFWVIYIGETYGNQPFGNYLMPISCGNWLPDPPPPKTMA